jgi:hypothetical protein
MVHPEDQQVECLLRQIDPHARRETPPIRFYRKYATRPHVEAQRENAGLTGGAPRKFRNSFVSELLG